MNKEVLKNVKVTFSFFLLIGDFPYRLTRSIHPPNDVSSLLPKLSPPLYWIRSIRPAVPPVLPLLTTAHRPERLLMRATPAIILLKRSLSLPSISPSGSPSARISWTIPMPQKT